MYTHREQFEHLFLAAERLSNKDIKMCKWAT